MAVNCFPNRLSSGICWVSFCKGDSYINHPIFLGVPLTVVRVGLRLQSFCEAKRISRLRPHASSFVCFSVIYNDFQVQVGILYQTTFSSHSISISSSIISRQWCTKPNQSFIFLGFNGNKNKKRRGILLRFALIQSVSYL